MLYETMEMEESALNVAHSLERRALICLKRRRYDEAIFHHNKAVEALEQAFKQTENPQAILSLRVQRDFHATQARVIQARKEQYICLRKAVEMEKCAAKMLSRVGNEQEENMKLRLFNMLNTAEALINELANRKSLSDDKNEDETNALLALEELNNPRSANDPKDSLLLVQELHLLIINLHALVIQIANQLDESEVKREQLEQKISKLESFWKQTIASPSGSKNTQVAIRTPSPVKSPLYTRQSEPSTSRGLPRNPIVTTTVPLTAPTVIRAGIPGPESICQFPNFAEFEIPERPPLPPLPPLDLPDLDLASFASSSRYPALRQVQKDNDDKDNFGEGFVKNEQDSGMSDESDTSKI